MTARKKEPGPVNLVSSSIIQMERSENGTNYTKITNDNSSEWWQCNCGVGNVLQGPSIFMDSTLNGVASHEFIAGHVYLVMAIIFPNKDGHF